MIRWCSSLIRKSQIGDALELPHFTVKEFLLSLSHTSPLAAYRLDPTFDDSQLAKVCLTHLCSEDFETTVTQSETALNARRRQYPLRRYATMFWGQLDMVNVLLDHGADIDLPKTMEVFHYREPFGKKGHKLSSAIWREELTPPSAMTIQILHGILQPMREL